MDSPVCLGGIDPSGRERSSDGGMGARPFYKTPNVAFYVFGQRVPPFALMVYSDFMSEKTPRIRPHEATGPFQMPDLQRLGARMYHYASRAESQSPRPEPARAVDQLRLVDPDHPERGWRMDPTSGMPVPDQHDVGPDGDLGA